MDHSAVYVGLVALGMLGNLMWMIANLRIEGRITTRLDALKDWLEQRYVSNKEWEGCRDVCAAWHTEICRRMDAVEKRA